MTRPSYEKTSKELMEWCTDNGVYYYGAGREEFSFSVAGEEAMKEDRKVVLFEDLS
jgi:hypothetical protein